MCAVNAGQIRRKMRLDDNEKDHYFIAEPEHFG